jgi:hypothetical protein
MVDATIVKVHRHGQGAKGDEKQVIGRSKGGMTTSSATMTAPGIARPASPARHVSFRQLRTLVRASNRWSRRPILFSGEVIRGEAPMPRLPWILRPRRHLVGR